MGKDSVKAQSKPGESEMKSKLSFSDKNQVSSVKPLSKPNFNVQVKDSVSGKMKDSGVSGFTKVINADPKVQKENAMINKVKLGVNSAESPTSIKLNSNSTSLALSNGSSRPSNVIGTTTLTPAS